jgi:hypothetical protein
MKQRSAAPFSTPSPSLAVKPPPVFGIEVGMVPPDVVAGWLTGAVG